MYYHRYCLCDDDDDDDDCGKPNMYPILVFWLCLDNTGLLRAPSTSMAMSNTSNCSGGRNSSLVVFWLAVHSVAGSILLWGKFSGRGDFSRRVKMGSNSIPPKTLSNESIIRGLVCAHMHFIARTQKILTFMSWTGECRQQKHTQQAPSTKTECDYLNGWIKKRSHTQKSHPKVVNPRDIAGEREKNKTKTVPRAPNTIDCHSSSVHITQFWWVSFEHYQTHCPLSSKTWTVGHVEGARSKRGVLLECLVLW